MLAMPPMQAAYRTAESCALDSLDADLNEVSAVAADIRLEWY
jgi:hypothetical protein